MSKMSKAIAALGVVAGLGVAALPLSSYAAGEYSVNSKVTTVSTEVEGAISIEVDRTTVNLGALKLNGVATGENEGDNQITITVSGNSATAYDLSIKSVGGNELKNTTKGTSIPAISDAAGIATLAGGVDSWGYKVNGTGNWFGLKSNDEATSINTVTADDWNDKSSTTTVEFGATAGNNLAEGTYQGQVVFTATVK